jgi:hypothetical protein
MVFGSGESSSGYLDPNFFIKEARQLQLTPDIAQQFKLITQDLVGELQRDINATSEGLITFLNQATHSGKDIVQAIKQGQAKVDAHFQSHLDQAKSQLLQSVGEEHASAIDQFIEDLRKELTPLTRLKEDLRQNPLLKNKLPPTTIFELSATAAPKTTSKKEAMALGAPKPAEDPIQSFLDTLTQQWEKQFPPGSSQDDFAQTIKKLVQILRQTNPNATLDDIVKAINSQLINTQGKQDIYMRYVGLTQDQLNTLGKLLSTSKTPIEVPAFTRMDQKCVDTFTWLNKQDISPQDKSLANQLLGEIQSLGSSDNMLASLQASASVTATSSGTAYQTATFQGQAQFASITHIPQTTPVTPGHPNTPPPKGPLDSGGTGGMDSFMQDLQRRSMMNMAMKYSIQNLISMMAQQSKVSISSESIQNIANKVMDTSHINMQIGNNPPYSPNQTVPPGTPLPTNSWWTLLADNRSAGALGLTVVADNTTIDNPKSQIHLSDALMFDPNAKVDSVVTVQCNTAFSPNVNQVPYNVQSYNDGFAFNPSEQFDSASNGSSAYSQLTPYLMVAGAQENLIFPPTVIANDDNSVTLLYKTKQGGTMTVPITRGSPYMTFQYQNTTPYFNSTSTPLDIDSVHAYFYKQVVDTVTDPNTQISVSQARSLGLDAKVGDVDLVENTNGPPWKGGIQGQVFTYSTMPAGVTPGDTYRLYFSSPVTLNPCDYITETVIPESVPIPDPNPNHYIHDSTKKPYSTEQSDDYSSSKIATGLQANAPFNGTARTVKLPTSAAPQGAGGASLLNDTLQEIYSLIAQGKNMSDLLGWATGLLSNTNFLQDYPHLSGDDFSQFCRLTGLEIPKAESMIAQTWYNRIPMDPSNPDHPLPQYQNWFTIASRLKQMMAGGNTPAQIQQWLQNVVNGKDSTYSPLFATLDPINQQLMKTFSELGPSTLTPETSLNQAFTDALAAFQKTAPDLYTKTLNTFDQNAWDIPVSGHYNSDGLGKWNYTYTTAAIDPYKDLKFKNPPPASSGHILIGLLKTDFTYLDGTQVIPNSYYETIKGEMELVETTNNQINFYDKDTVVSWPDDDLAKLSATDRNALATQYIAQAGNLWLPDRHSNQTTYSMGKDIQNAADIAHGLWKLAQLDPSLKQLPGFANALSHATQIGEAGLDDYLTGGLLAYDNTNGMIISTFGQEGPYVDYSNAYGEDHHFAYGYLIRSAAELRQVDPTWFQDPKYGSQRTEMVNLLVKDVFNVQNDSGFPRMRMWDPFVGIGRATGLVPPAGNGMNEESTAEDYNCIQGIAMWAQMDGNKDLENQAATMAERVKNAAQAYWQPNSATSIYTDKYAPEAARRFAQKVISCGVNWDNSATSANFFTPKNGDPNIYTIAIEYITGNGKLVDPQAAMAAFNYLINQNDSSGFARIFQNNIPLNTPGAVGYFSYIPILIPLIAKVSPNAATAILNWFQKANSLQPNVYGYDTGCNYATIYQQILMAKATNTQKDPYSSPEAFQSKLPSLPPQDPNPVLPPDVAKGTALYFLSPWSPKDGIYAKLMPLIDAEVATLKQQGNYTQQALDNWIAGTLIPKYPNQGLTVGGIDDLYSIYNQMSVDGRKLMQALADHVDQMKGDKSHPCDMQTLSDWVTNTLLPSVPHEYPSLNNFDIRTFCKVAQLDIHAFEAPSPPPSTDPLDQYVQAIDNWEKGVKSNTEPWTFAEDIKKLIQSMEGKKKTLAEVITEIGAKIFNNPDFPNADIYMRYLGLSQSQADTLSNLISDGTHILKAPLMTKIDQIHAEATAWGNSPNIDPKDRPLGIDIIIETQNLGSYGKLDTLTQWAQNYMKTSPHYSSATDQGKIEFQKLMGIPDPLQTYVDQITNWEKGLDPNSPQYKGEHDMAEAIKNLILSMEYQNKPLNDVLTAIHNQIYQDPKSPQQDVYMRYPGLTETAMKALSQILTDGAHTPPFTAMDQKFQDTDNWLKSNLTGNDKTIAQDLIAEIQKLGSQASADALKTWATDYIKTSPYAGAADSAKTEFQKITGASPPPPDPLDQYVQAINNWEKGLDPNSPQYKGEHDMAEAIKNLILSMEHQNKPLNDVLTAIHNQIYQDPKSPQQDVYMRYPGLTETAMKALSQILTDGAHTPSFTAMDQKFQDTDNWLKSNLTGNDKTIAQDLIAEIQKLGSQASADALKTWATDYIKTSPYAGASNSAKTAFQNITGVSPPPPTDTLAALEKEIAAYLQQRTHDFTQFLLDLGISPSAAPTTLAGWERLAKIDASQANKLAADLSIAKTPAALEALRAKWGLPPGNADEIKKEANARLQAYRNVMEGCGDQSAINLFTSTLQEIQQLEKPGGTLTQLQAWADKVTLANYPNLTADDLKEFNRLKQ